jgi:hypothetical protein
MIYDHVFQTSIEHPFILATIDDDDLYIGQLQSMTPSESIYLLQILYVDTVTYWHSFLRLLSVIRVSLVIAEEL